MDEMRVLQRLGEETGLPTADRLSAARTRLEAAMTTTAAGTGAVRRARRPARRMVLTGVATAGVAASLAAVLVLAPDRTGGSTSPAQADPARILRGAAATALRLPDVEPRPGQFVYTRSREGRDLRESWRSVDGTRDGLVVEYPAAGRQQFVLPGCRDGRAVAVKGGQVVPGVTERCVPEPAYHADLPTDAAGMRAYLNKLGSGEAGDSNAAGKDVLYLLGEYLRPPSRAALFEAAATTPGLTVVERATDGAGRSGVGISWPSPGGANPAPLVLVFDPKTYAFLGVGGGAGTSATLTVAVVDRVGQTS